MTDTYREPLDPERERLRTRMLESMKTLDGSLASTVALLTGLSREEIEALGGVGDWDDKAL